MPTSREEKARADGFLKFYRESGIAPMAEQIIAEGIARVQALLNDDDHWRIVGVYPTDPLPLIESVYKAKAKYYHPDAQGGGNEPAFLKLTEAYATIKEERQQDS